MRVDANKDISSTFKNKIMEALRITILILFVLMVLVIAIKDKNKNTICFNGISNCNQRQK